MQIQTISDLLKADENDPERGLALRALRELLDGVDSLDRRPAHPMPDWVLTLVHR